MLLVMKHCQRICENGYFLQINAIFKVSPNGRDPFVKGVFVQPFMYFMVSNKPLMGFAEIVLCRQTGKVARAWTTGKKAALCRT